MTLDDLIPQETEITINGKKYLLAKYSMKAKRHFLSKYPNFIDKLKEENNELIFSEIAYFLLKDKTDFPSFDSWEENVCSIKEQMDMVTAVMQCMGINKTPYTDKDKEIFENEISEEDKKK